MYSSRKGTVDTAVHLTSQGGQYVHDATQAARLESAASSVKHKQLPSVLRAGVGFHYAAMEQEDRVLIEQLFLDRILPVSHTSLPCLSFPFLLKAQKCSAVCSFCIHSLS